MVVRMAAVAHPGSEHGLQLCIYMYKTVQFLARPNQAPCKEANGFYSWALLPPVPLSPLLLRSLSTRT